MVIREATIDDLNKILELKKLIKDDEKKYNNSLLDFDDVKEYYTNYTKNDIKGKYRKLFISEVKGEIVGIILGKQYRSLKIAGYKLRGYVSNLYVKKEFRKKGIAKKLINKLFSWFKEKGVKEMTLEIYFGNKIARELYGKLGFENYSVKMLKKLD